MEYEVVVFDKLMYVGYFESLQLLFEDFCVVFVCGDIGCGEDVCSVFVEYGLFLVVNFVVESYVDCLIDLFGDFVQMNVIGIFELFDVFCY